MPSLRHPLARYPPPTSPREDLPFRHMLRFKSLLQPLPFFAATASIVVADDAQLRTLHSQPSFVIGTKQVELAVTQLGGHMAPVTFFRDTAQPVRPYYISPWPE